MNNLNAALYGAAAPDIIAAHVEGARAYCLANGYQPFATFQDELAFSASAGTSGLQALRAIAASGCVKVVVVGELKDISLRVADIENLVRDMDALDIEVHFSDVGRVTRAMVEFASVLNAKRRAYVTLCREHGKQKAAAAGCVMYTRVYGYRRNPDRSGSLLPEPTEAEVVRRVFGLAADEDQTPPQIARTIVDAGLLKDGRRAFAGFEIARMLRRELYRGDVVFGRYRHERDPGSGRITRHDRPRGEWIVTHAPELRLVDDGTWERAQRRLG